MADTPQQWYTMQVQGKWLKTQAASLEEAKAKMSGAPAHFDPSGVPEAMRGTAGVAHPDWPEQALADIRFGGGRTLVGRGLQAIGFPKTGLADSELGKFMMGPLYGPLEAAHGAGIAAKPGRTTEGLMEMMGGIFHGTGLAGGAMQPEFLPTATRFGMFQEGAARIGKNLGLTPTTNAWVSLILATAGTGAILDPRARFEAIQAEKRAIRASRGFGAQIDEQAIQRAAEENVSKAEAQANSIQDIAKRTGQNVAQVLQSGASSVTGVHHADENLTEKFGKEAKPGIPETKRPPDDIRARIADLHSQLEAARTRELSPTERVKQLVKGEDELEQARRRAVAPKPDIGVVNLVPEAERASTKIVQAEKEELARKIETRAAAKEAPKEPIPTSIEATPEQALAGRQRKAALMQEAGMYWDSYAHGWRPIEGAERPAPEPTPLEAKQAEMKQRQTAEQAKVAQAKDLMAETRSARQKELDALRTERAEAPVSAEVGREPAPPEAPKPAPAPVQAPEPTKKPGEPVPSTKGPEISLGEVRQKLAQTLIDEGMADKKTAGKLADHIMSSKETAEGLMNNPKASERMKTILALGKALAEKAEQEKPHRSAIIKPIGERVATPETTAKVDELTSRPLRTWKDAEEITKGLGEVVSDLKGRFAAFDRAESAPKIEPRSLRGDLGERPAEPPAPSGGLASKSAQERLAIHKERTAQWMKEHPGVSKTHAAQVVAEQMRKEMGAVGGGEPDDRQIRREAKIKGWIDTLRDEKASPQSIDNAFKMLKAFGLDDNEIIRRVSGAEGFAKDPKEILDRYMKHSLDSYLTGDEEAADKGGEAFEELRALGMSDPEIAKLIARHPSFKSFPPEMRESIERDIPREERGQKPDEADQRLADAERSLEERIGPDVAADAEAARLMGEPVDLRELGAQAVAKRVGEEVGKAEIPGVIRPGDEELERMFKLPDTREIDAAEKALKIMREDAAAHDKILEAVRFEHPDWSLSEQLMEAAKRAKKQQGERGFWTLMPAKRAPKPRPTGSTLDELTAKLESSMKAVPPDDNRMKFAERLDKTITEGWDKVQISLGRIASQAVALKDMYMREPELTDYRSSVGRFSGALNRSAWELRQFTKAIREKLPDQRRREAVTNWIQAGGDDAVLADRAARSKGSLRAGYEAARTLTDDEKNIASFIQAHFEKRLKDAIHLDLLKDGLENYVPQIWKAKDQTGVLSFYSSLHRSGLLKPDFNAAKRRIYESYFEGEQAGRVPVNKDIGFLVAAWDKAFNQALASRIFVRELADGLAKDGRPIIAPSGVGRPITEGAETVARIIYPKAGPDDTGDYVAVNHSALTKHVWVGTGEDGEPIFLKGDLRVHPDHAQTLDNVINRGKWAAAHPIQTAILKGQGFFKATLLSMSPFHQIQEGTHALFHKVNPFNPPAIDLTNPAMNKLLDHGLVIGNFDPVAAFDEGLTAGGGGLVGKIPGLGRFQQKYSEYLFHDYIPRLKAKMATEAYERNLHRFQDSIAQGNITTNQIAELTANQANAAFGELNYVMMGRNPQTQAIMRMMFLAPDFLEARARFVGQALRPTGREQYAALFRGALGMYTTARILNKLLDDDYHWDKPFSLIVHGYEYRMRSLPGDIWYMLTDTNSFIMHRLNPLLVKQGWEFASGKDDFGRRRTLGEQVMDAVRSVTPIPGQSFYRSAEAGGLPGKIVGGLIASAGITKTKYRTKAGALAHQYAVSEDVRDITSHHVSEIVQDITSGQLDGNKVGRLLIDGKMNPRDLQTALKLAAMPELYRDYQRLPVELKAKVFLAATPAEKALLISYAKREPDTSRLLPEQRQEFMKEFANQ